MTKIPNLFPPFSKGDQGDLLEELNPNTKYRNPKQTRIFKIQKKQTDSKLSLKLILSLFWSLKHSNLGFVSNFVLRISSFSGKFEHINNSLWVRHTLIYSKYNFLAIRNQRFEYLQRNLFKFIIQGVHPAEAQIVIGIVRFRFGVFFRRISAVPL